jgi:hypothetical protein
MLMIAIVRGKRPAVEGRSMSQSYVGTGDPAVVIP